MLSLSARRIAPIARVTLKRSLHAATRPRLALSAAGALPARRFEHTSTPEQTLRERADFQADWIAPIVPYERVKALTEQPSEVRRGTRCVYMH